MRKEMKRLAPALALLLATALALTSCILQLPSPSVEIRAQSAYNDEEILIPFEVWGEGSYARARWRLRRYDAPEGEYLEDREIRIVSGGSGVLQLGRLDDWLYELEFELLTTRDGSFEVVPYLRREVAFYVDRATPSSYTFEYRDENNVPVAGQGGLVAPFAPALQIDARIVPDPPAASESPVRVLAVVDEIRPLIPGQDERPTQFTIWRSPDPEPSTMTFVLIDEAGNRSEVFLESY